MDGHRARVEASRESATVATENCPDPRSHYVTEVNKGSINATVWAGSLNVRYQNGYRLAHVYEIGGNTVQVFEHNHP